MKILRFIEKVFNKIEKRVVFPMFAAHRQKKLKTKEFTIISNNCWGGVCYEYFNLPKQSPTIGAYFYAEDYVKFCSKLKEYLSYPLVFINTDESKYYDDLCKKNEQNSIIGKLNDIEIIFLHYSERKQIIEKWNRRIKRIKWDKIILKFSYQNLCTDELVKSFLQISEYSKFVLVGEHITDSPDEILFKRSNGKETLYETENFTKFFNIIKTINSRL